MVKQLLMIVPLVTLSAMAQTFSEPQSKTGAVHPWGSWPLAVPRPAGLPAIDPPVAAPRPLESAKACSIPLLHVASSDHFDDRITIHVPAEAFKAMPQVKVPAPPCDDKK